MNAELSKMIATVITNSIPLVMGYLIATWKYRNFKEARRLKHLDVEKMKTSHEYFASINGNYDKFVSNSNEEMYFYARTGIKTTFQNIPKYIKLKEELVNYSWQKIKDAKPHFDLNTEEVKLKPFEVYFMWSMCVFGFLIIAVGMYLLNIKVEGTFIAKLYALVKASSCFLIGFLLIRIPNSIYTAFFMKKDLDKVRDID